MFAQWSLLVFKMADRLLSVCVFGLWPSTLQRGVSPRELQPSPQACRLRGEGTEGRNDKNADSRRGKQSGVETRWMEGRQAG